MSNEEKTSPELFKNRIDLKSLTVYTLADIINDISSEKLANLQIVILTNLGMVTGDIVDDVGTEWLKKIGEDGYTIDLENLLINIRNKSITEWEQSIDKDKARIINDSSYIAIKNAVLTPFANPNATFTFEQLLLFGDQISGVSLRSK